MKISSTTTNREQGGVLILSLLTCIVIGIVLASFLLLLSTRHKLAIRSMGWNSAIPVLEAGIEEALTHLKKSPKAPATDGWTATTVGGQVVHVKQRDLPDGSYYKVTIYDATSKNPLIYSQGFVLAPLDKYKYITRLVRVDVTNPPSLYVRGITTKQSIKMGGGGVVDGFDSSIGVYNPLTNRLSYGGIATMGTVAEAIDVGNSKIYGTATTGAGGTVKVGSVGSIGDTNWVNGGNHGAQTGATDNNFNASFPTNAPPDGPFQSPTLYTAGGSNAVLITGGTNQISFFKSKNDKDIMIVTGDATLYVTGDVNISGGGHILILPGASLKMYLGGNAVLGGGAVINQNQLASKFSLIALPSCTSITVGGSSAFFGTINAPQADVVMNGTADFFGALIANSYRGVGGAGFHYDTAITSDTAPLVGSWREL